MQPFSVELSDGILEDLWARVTSALGRFHSDVVRGIHIGSVDLDWPEPLPDMALLSQSEGDYLKRVRRWEREEGAYGEKDLVVPREWADRCYNIERWTEMPAGGHFPALEEPGLLVQDIRAFFRGLR